MTIQHVRLTMPDTKHKFNLADITSLEIDTNHLSIAYLEMINDRVHEVSFKVKLHDLQIVNVDGRDAT